uniref:Transposase n=1 Tax=Globodera pallida TaxID=36090 RepID=A0A183CL75_GLOPA
MSLTTKLRRLRKKPPEGWDLIEPTLEEFEAKMREAETEPHEGKRKTETVWPLFRVTFLLITLGRELRHFFIKYGNRLQKWWHLGVKIVPFLWQS